MADDSRSDYTSNEPACDYMAGLSGALAALVSRTGSPLVPGPIPVEPVGQEFSVSVGINTQGAGFTEFKIIVAQMTSWPARRIPLSYRYYLDFSDVAAMNFADGIAPHIAITTNYMQGNPTVSTLQYFSENIYFVEVAWTAANAPYPAGQGLYTAETQVNVLIETCGIDMSNKIFSKA